MDQVKIEGGILGEDFAFKQENITNTEREIVEILKEDIQSDDEEVPKENEELEDQFNTEISCLPDELAVIDSGQIEIKDENEDSRSNDQLERDSESNCGVTIFKEEKEESDVIDLRISRPNTSLNNKTIEEKNGRKFCENASGQLLFFLQNTEYTTHKKPVTETAPVAERENSLLHNVLTRKKNNKNDLYDNQATSTVNECASKDIRNPNRICMETTSSNSNSLLFSWLNKKESNSKNTCVQGAQKATAKTESRRKRAEQGKSRMRTTGVYWPQCGLVQDGAMRDQNIVRCRNINSDYNNKGFNSTVKTTGVFWPQCFRVQDRPIKNQNIVENRNNNGDYNDKDPFSWSSDDDIFGNDCEMESRNVNITREAKTDGTREKPVENMINNSSSQNNDIVQEKQLLENNQQGPKDFEKLSVKPAQQNNKRSDNSDANTFKQDNLLNGSKTMEKHKSDDDNMFGNDCEMESRNDNETGKTETDGIREESMKKQINNSSGQKNNWGNEKQLLENNQQDTKDSEKNSVKPAEENNKRSDDVDDNTSRQDSLPNGSKKMEKHKSVADYQFEKIGNNEHGCSNCQIIMDKTEDVVRHVRHRKKRKCPHCHKEVYRLAPHIYQVHTDEKDITYFRCHLCEFKAKWKHGLKQHVLYVHRELEDMDRMHQCHLCNKKSITRWDLMKHQERVHKKTRLQCAHCNFRTCDKEDLTKHVEEHMNPKKVKTHKCPACKFTTLYGNKYRKHQDKHVEKNWQCHICSYQTNSLNSFNLHMISHKEVKDEKDYKYKCDKCDYKTYRANNLRMHKLTHVKPEEIKYFYCYHCNFKTKRKDNLSAHIRRHREQDNTQFQCFVCDFSAKSRGELIRHIDKHSKGKQN